MTYSSNSPRRVLSVPDNALYLSTLSNVQTIDLSNIQLRNDGTLRRSINNSNNIGIDGVSFCNQTLSNIKWVNASNIQSVSLTTSNIVNTGSNNPLYIYSSNQINLLSSNQTYINAPSVVVNYGVSFDNSNNVLGISNVVSQNLSNNSFYTSGSNVMVKGDINTASMAVNNSQLLLNKKMISSNDFSNACMWTSNNKLYCNELVVNGIMHVPVIDMLPTVNITSNYSPGLYTRSLMTINATDSTIVFQDSLNSTMLQSGTYTANRAVTDLRWQQNANVNVFNY
ncbi:MAG: hypothetical protein EOP45_21895 [Sphingobacteriaceae bacterium]|nr:MAG: hypothetical protein EOP45_21895 [Sphingobacteriaceae bacterium]